MKLIEQKNVLLRNYLTLYYFQEIVDQNRVYYDRNKYRRIYENVHKYALCHFRQLNSELADKQTSLHINKNPLHLRLIKYFFIFIAIRCFSILFIRPATATRERRIYLVGTEFLQRDSPYVETTALFWSCISVLFLQFTLKSSLLDYKFMALYRMSVKNGNYLHPSKFGLNQVQFEQFRLFRAGALFYYNFIMSSLPPFASVTICFLHYQAKVYATDLVVGIIWSAIICYWIYIVCSLIYSNLVAFIVVAKYIHIKQRSIASSIKKSLLHMRFNQIKLFKYDQIAWQHFMRHNERYSHMQAELDDYNQFWSSYLSFVFVFYVLLISFIVYVAVFAQLALYMRATYYLIFNFHIFLLSVIMYYCGGIVRRNERLSTSFSSMLAHFVQSYSRLRTVQYLKVHNINEYLNQISRSGFCLLNGYLITHDTFRLV